MRVEPRGQGALERPADAGEGAGGGLQLSRSAGPALRPGALSDQERGASSLPPVPAALALRSGAPAAPSQPLPRTRGLPRPPATRQLSSGPFHGGRAFISGSAGAMERATGPLRNAFSGQVLKSKTSGAPPDCGLRGGSLPAEPRASRGNRAGAPHPAPGRSPCPGGAFLPVTSHPEERRALWVSPEPVSSVLAVPGQPRDSARWMLCVAGAKLKVSGKWARSSVSAGGCLRLRRVQRGLALRGSLSGPGGRLLLLTLRRA